MLEHKAFRLKLSEVSDAGRFSGYASVFGNVDSYGDIVERGAFARTIDAKGGRFPILWQHNAEEPIGVSVAMGEDPHGLAVDGELNLETRRGREAHALLKQGALEGLSIGYETVNAERDGKHRRLTEVKLWEFSVVTFPANQLATVTAVKAAAQLEALTSWATREVEGVKAGRVLSAGNQALVESAIEALRALLAAAGNEPDEDTEPATMAADPAIATLLALRNDMLTIKSGGRL